MKIWKLAAIIALVFSSNVYAADTVLKNNINTISLTPGPQCDTGATCTDETARAHQCVLFVTLNTQYSLGLTLPEYCSTPTTTYAIGDTGPAGGIVFHITDGGLHGLEAATEDSAQSQWGCYGTLLSGANGTAVGTGEQNTADIIASCNETTAASVAAAVGPGWFLPSKDEAHLLHRARQNAGVLGGFMDGDYPYWTSSQGNNNIAWVWEPIDGVQYGKNKVASLRLRAIRAF